MNEWFLASCFLQTILDFDFFFVRIKWNAIYSNLCVDENYFTYPLVKENTSKWYIYNLLKKLKIFSFIANLFAEIIKYKSKSQYTKQSSVVSFKKLKWTLNGLMLCLQRHLLFIICFFNNEFFFLKNSIHTIAISLNSPIA